MATFSSGYLRGKGPYFIKQFLVLCIEPCLEGLNLSAEANATCLEGLSIIAPTLKKDG